MPVIRANRESVDDRFSVLGFSIRTESPLYEVGIASDPELFKAENRARRNRHNFYSSRAIGGALRARRGEAVYLVPPDVMQNFVGQPKLYYGLATYADNSGGTPNFVQNPSTGSMFVNIAQLSERGLRRLAGRPSGSTSYGGNGAALAWGGDVMAPADANAAAPAPAAAPVDSKAPASQPAASAPAAKSAPPTAASLKYDDGFGEFPTSKSRPTAPVRSRVTRAMEEDYELDQGGGIDGPVPDDNGARSTTQGVRALDAPQAEYPGASRFAPAHKSNYRSISDTRRIDYVVIHITDGGSKITGTIGWFQNPDQRNARNQPIHVSAHYVVGQDGEVVQMVRNNDMAWHASQANAHSIGIEHVANKRGLNPTEAQYQGSAALVAWLCGQFNLPVDRDHIVGHYEISPKDDHDCPSKIWDWDHYMDLVQAAVNAASVPAQAESLAYSVPSRGKPALTRRAIVPRAQGADPSAKFVWPSMLDEPPFLVKSFIEAFNARVDDGVRGGPAPDPTQYKGYEDADDRAREAALKTYIPQIRDALLSDSSRRDVSDALLRIATAVSLQVFDIIKDSLPAMLYAPILIDASEPPPTVSPNVTMPRAMPYVCQRIGVYMAWVDAAIQQATADTAMRIRMQKEQWEGMLGGIDAGFTMLGFIPGAGGQIATFVGMAVHAIVSALAPDFDKQYASFAGAMQAIRGSYRALNSEILKAVVREHYNDKIDLGNFPLNPDVQAMLDAHAGGALLGWQNELAFLGVGASPTAQSLGLRKVAVSKAQEIITPFYDPKDPASALTCQNDAFSQAREEWFVGVDNTTIFPHSAICQINTVDSTGNGWGGTGFYIGRNRILTAAHVLNGMVTATIIPGKDDANEPFGRCTVASSTWRVAPTYSGGGNFENDLAVIDNVPIAAPGGQWFGFLNATPSDQMPIVVCGYSAASDAVPELTKAIDGDKQHLHGGFASGMSNPEVIEYPILTLHGASGAPVYHIDAGSGTLQALVCAVHVTGKPAAQGLNRGCFITPTKIDWIEGRASAFALEAPASLRRAPLARSTVSTTSTAGKTSRKPRASAQGMFDLLPVDLKLRVFIPAPAVVETVPVVGARVPGRPAHGGDGRGFQFKGGTSRAEVTATFHFGGSGAQPSLSDITRTFGESVNYDADDTVDVSGKPSWYRNVRPGAKPIARDTQTVTDSKLSVVMGGSSNDGMVSMVENAVVVTFEVHASNPLVTGAPDIDATLAVLLRVNGDRVEARLRGGHDEFPAYELYANGVLVYSYDPVAEDASPWGLVGDGNWDVNPETSYVDVGPATEYRIVGHAAALEYTSFSLHWDDAPYQPQSNDHVCWAAAAAMVVGWRDQVCIPDEEIAKHVPIIDAYRSGLPPKDRITLADAWNLVAEPPASYSVDALRQMLQSYGPLYIGMKWDKQGGGHARVLVGMESDGNPDGSGTTMFMYDPWPDTPGRIRMSFADFVDLYEGRMTSSGGVVDVQVLHADSAQGRAPATVAPFALSLAVSRVRTADEARRFSTVRRPMARPVPARAAALRAAASRLNVATKALEATSIDNAVPLVPQPDKLSCWAAAMTMLLSFRRQASFTPESLANDVGQSLMQSYSWDLLKAVRDRYGFTVIDVPSNTSLYFDAAQWARWLQQYGPLWVVIVGMPHAVVVSGIRGDTSDSKSAEVHILNPWDTRIAFDNDPVAFNPSNGGFDSWQPFDQFASDFGNMAEPNYGNWRILYLPAGVATTQGVTTGTRARQRWASPPPKVRAQGTDAPAGDTAIDPTRVPGTTMRTVRGQGGRISWQLDQLEGTKSPDPAPAVVGVEYDNTLVLDQWPRYGADPVPLPLTVRWTSNGSALGNVRIEPGAVAATSYDVEVVATIDDDTTAMPPARSAVACLKVIVEYRFRGSADGDRTARADLRLYGNGGHDRDSRWI